MINPSESSCTGCGACKEVCPVHCISMLPNSNGFLMPSVDSAKCLKCGLCEKKCPASNQIEKETPRYVYAAFSNDKNEIYSASGGVFYTLASFWIKSSGVVFGAAFDGDLKLKIIDTCNLDDLQKLQGVKYLQADTEDSYKKVKDYLLVGKKVLYSGTPCQIAGLKSFISNKNDENLLTVEVICHGVLSPKMFSDYCDWIERTQKKKICGYHFRTKKTGSQDFNIEVIYQDETREIISGFRDAYYKNFLKADSCRESCYSCPFASKDRVADITIGDFWNIEDVDINFGKGKRVSCVLLNSNKAKRIWFSENLNIKYIETDWRIAVKGNSNLLKSTERPASYFSYGNIENTDEFFENSLHEKGNRKRALFNKLPMSLRRRIKKLHRER